MKKYRLDNGVTLLFHKTNTNSVTANVLVKTGSNNETKDTSGISHFVEHMLFEGTKKRPSSLSISNEIEKLGGILNAYTSGEITNYYIKLMNRHFDKALGILADMLLNSVFSETAIEKEKKVILKELHMVTDEPRFYQWRLFQQTLFRKHPARNPTLGTISSIKGIDKKKIIDYYSGHYSGRNIVVSVVGNISNVKFKVEKYFSKLTSGRSFASKPVKEPKQIRSIKVEKRKILSCYWIIGYKTPKRSSRESYVLDIINAILGRGQSGRIFDEVRNKHGMAYEVGVNYEPAKGYGFFAVYASTDKKNLKKGKSIVLEEFRKLQNVKDKDLNEAKTYIEGRYKIEMDETDKFAEGIAYWEFLTRAEDALDYVNKIKRVTVDDVRRVAKKYLNEQYTMVVLEPR